MTTPINEDSESRQLRAELPETKPAKKKKWWRRVRILALLVLILVVLSRAIVVVLLPPVLHHVAGYYGLDATYQRLELSVLGGDTGLWNLVITAKDSKDPIAVIDYCRGDISTLNLLRLRLEAWRVEADGVHLTIDRKADGTIPLLKLINDNLPASKQPTPVAKAAAQPSKIDLTSPLRLDALRLSHIRLHLRDQSISPPLDSVVGVDLRLSDLGGESTVPTRFSADVDADPFLDALHVNGEGTVDQGTISATFESNMNGLRLRPLAPYLALIGLRPMANETTARASGALTLGPSATNPNIAAASLKLDNVSLLADGEEAVGLDHLLLDAPALDPLHIGLKLLQLENLRLVGRRAVNGNPRFAGLEYIGMPARTASTKPAEPSAPLSLPIIELPLVDIKNVSATIHDDSVKPPVDLALLVDNFAVKQILIDPAHPDATITLAGLAHLPGIAGNVHLDGSAKPMAATKTVGLNVSADGVALDAIKPYLDLLGVSSSIHDATFTADVSADVTPKPNTLVVNASVQKLKLTQGGDLVAMDHITLSNAAITQSPLGFAIDDISLHGPTLGVSRNADGTYGAANLKLDPKKLMQTLSAPSSPTTKPVIASTAPVAPMQLPAFVLKHFKWDGIDISYDDAVLSPAVHTRVADAGAEYQDSKFHAWAKVPRIVDDLALDGAFSHDGNKGTAAMKFAASGIDASIVAPFLAPLHIEPTLKNGAVTASLAASGEKMDQTFGGRLQINHVTYSDGNTELAGVDEIVLDGIHFDTAATPPTLAIGRIDVGEPRTTVTYEKTGAIAAAGLRVLPAAYLPTDDGDAPPPSTQPATPPVSEKFPLIATLDAFHLYDASIRVIDQWKSTDTTATASVDLNHFAIGKAAAPATLTVKAAIKGVIDQATVNGTVVPDLAAPSADLAIAASGIRSGQLAVYIPPGIKVLTENGQFKTHLQASLAAAKAGGHSAKLIVEQLDFRGKGAQQPLAKIASARIIASRIDPAAGVIALDEVSTEGVELSAARTASGGIRAIGIDLETPPPAAESASTASVAAAAPAKTKPVRSVASLVASARKTVPSLSLDRLNLTLHKFTFTDEMRPKAAPLAISDLRFRNLDKIDWGGPDPDSKSATHFRMDCTIDPLVSAVTMTALVNPLAAQPTLTADVLASGIRGNGLTELVPEISPYIRGSELTDGEFHVHTDATVRMSRRGDSIDYAGPIDADLDVKPITFRATAGGPILAGLDEIHSDGIHVEPRTGAVHVKTLEITKPIGRVSREKDGIHVLGVVFQPPAKTATTEPTTESAPPLSNPTTAPAMRPAKPAAEIRVDQVVMSDLDATVTDNTVDPPLVVPLTGLDVEVRDFTNMAPYEDRPVKFSALVNAGKVRLPKPLAASGLGGALSDAGKLFGGKKVATTRQYEDRELFSEASANGKIGLYPAPNGYIKTSLGGFELGSLKGEAAQFGISLTDGVFDSTVDAKLPGDGSIQTRARFVATDMVLSEPPDGPIFRYLHLPAPLDTVIGVLQDADGAITVPLDVPVKNNSLSAAALAGPAISAFGSIVTTAIANTPLKAVDAFSGIIGFGGKKDQAPEPPIALQFDAGDTTLTSADQTAIAALKKRLIDDQSLTLVIKHELGGGDLKTAEMRSNPSPQDAQYLAEQMRQEQIASAQMRSDLAGVALSAIQRGASSDDAVTKLRQVDQQMAQTDEAMDRLYDLLRPGADRMASRRTRATCITYGRDRLAAIQSALLDHAPADVADRIHLLTPQYSQPSDDAGGTVIVQLVPKKK